MKVIYIYTATTFRCTQLRNLSNPLQLKPIFSPGNYGNRSKADSSSNSRKRPPQAIQSSATFLPPLKKLKSVVILVFSDGF
ncbi:hypothetical protein GQ457_16G000030 [Hibiscus cannabinus]